MKVRVLENHEEPDELGMQLEVGEVYMVDRSGAARKLHFGWNEHQGPGWAYFRTLGSHHSFKCRVEVVEGHKCEPEALTELF